MKAWFILLIGLISSWHFLDLNSDSRFYNLFLPMVFFLFLIFTVIKIAMKIGPEGGGSGGGSDGGFGDFGGGDCGGGD
ncbi:hypothetical protein QWY82_19220 [Simiduia curdlanivorans]|uniref:Glycine-rich protein n=1 Tax=Simiduia curdlanivorans TaxID=1492769 RepID=A0ABV8V512_9GAMM|nr:hypothetical protein [Simiduia curdlanivorans]MDN3640938.1 hypothetical protein [Simiduia curdlanivorans]